MGWPWTRKRKAQEPPGTNEHEQEKNHEATYQEHRARLAQHDRDLRMVKAGNEENRRRLEELHRIMGVDAGRERR